MHYVVHMTTDVAVGIVPPVEQRHRLLIARETTGLDRQDFAAEIGVSRNTISAAELGKTNPSKLLLRAWAMRTGVPLEWLETGNAPQPDGPEDDGVRHQGLEPRTRWFGGRFPDEGTSPVKRMRVAA